MRVHSLASLTRCFISLSRCFTIKLDALIPIDMEIQGEYTNSNTNFIKHQSQASSPETTQVIANAPLGLTPKNLHHYAYNHRYNNTTTILEHRYRSSQSKRILESTKESKIKSSRKSSFLSCFLFNNHLPTIIKKIVFLTLMTNVTLGQKPNSKYSQNK